jgi:type II secretory pathway pseudopilin PulG
MRNKSHGFVILDVMIGMAVVFGLAGLFATTMMRQQKVSRELAARREAVRKVEQYALHLQVGSFEDRGLGDDLMTLDILPDPPAADGWVWASIEAPADYGRVQLIALIPRDRINTADDPASGEDKP